LPVSETAPYNKEEQITTVTIMKHWHKILVVALLISATGLTGCEAKTEDSSQQKVQAETAPISEAALPVVLPEKAEVILKQGNAKQGRFAAVSAEQLTLTMGGQEFPFATKDVTEVKFKGDVRFMSDGKLVIRGEDEINSAADTWPNIPLSAFQVVEGTTSQAMVNLTLSSLSEAEQEGIVTVTTMAVYVVEQMQFEPEGKVTLTVKPALK
jgi:hypothetical protein